MKFNREDQLLPIISSNIKNFGQGLSQTFELSSGFGIADVVFYSLDKKIVQNRIKQKLSPIESYDLVKILTALNRIDSKTISLTFLKQAFPLVLKNNQGRVISFLIENNFLIPKTGDAQEFSIGEKYKIGILEIVAIEAKLSNWQRGLYQAYRYRQYANESYLALSTDYIHRALKHSEDFVRLNVGLLEVGDFGIKVHIKPTKECCKKNIFSALVFERLLSGENSFPSL